MDSELIAQGRILRIVAATVRVGGVVIIWCAVPLVWTHFDPSRRTVAVALAAALTLGAALVVWWERYVGSPGPATLLVDLPLGTAALVAGAWAAPGDAAVGWTYFAYPYTVLLSFTFGLSCRRMTGAIAAGGEWAIAYLAAAVLIRHGTPLAALPALLGYLANPVVGRLCARQVGAGSDDLLRAWRDEVAGAVRLAAGRERLRHARALHDHVLQTLETLARADVIADEALRGRVVDVAAWVRSAVRSGFDDAAEAPRLALARAAERARRSGLAVEIHDAALDSPGPLPKVPAERWAALDVALESLGRYAEAVSVRAEAEPGGLRLTVVARDLTGSLPGDAVAGLRARIDGSGGVSEAFADGVVEIWLPV
jgi:hypothetical protein